MALGQARCINPAGIAAWKKLADSYSAMTDRVETSATGAAENHIAAPARSAGAHSATGVFTSEDSHFVGVPTAHPDFDSALITEFGDLEHSPGAHIRHALWTSRDQAVDAFHKELSQW